MSLKFYSLLTLLFIILLGNYVFFFITSQSSPLELFGTHLPAYPIAVWSVLPVVLMYLITIVVMSVGNIQNYFRLKNYERDYEKLKDAFYYGYLQKERIFEYKTDRYKLVGELVANTLLKPKPGAMIETSPKIQTVFSTIEELDAGKTPDMKRFNLPKENPLMVQYATNLLRNDPTTSEKMLQNGQNFDDATIKEAFAVYAMDATMSNILKYKKYVSIRSLLQIIKRVDSKEHPIEISLETILDLCRHVTRDINQMGFIEIAIAVRNALIPEDRIKLFERLLAEKFDVNESLLYTFLDLEMLEKARELLENFSDDDFPRYRAFLALKDINYGCDINVLIESACQ